MPREDDKTSQGWLEKKNEKRLDKKVFRKKLFQRLGTNVL